VTIDFPSILALQIMIAWCSKPGNVRSLEANLVGQIGRFFDLSTRRTEIAEGDQLIPNRSLLKIMFTWC